ncbi:MAG TPA: response regulator [Dissulfurispiraceae bacterium]
MKILVVDDEELICWSLKRSFEKKEGHTVCCVNTGNDALQKVMENRYDVIITDLKLPDVSGAEFIKKINEVTKGAPMIVMSSHFPQPTLEDISGHGVFRCITKPFQIEDIISGVKEAAGFSALPSLQEK